MWRWTIILCGALCACTEPEEAQVVTPTVVYDDPPLLDPEPGSIPSRGRQAEPAEPLDLPEEGREEVDTFVPEGTEGMTPQQIMRACNFQNHCVVTAMERGPLNATTIPFLIEAYRNIGHTERTRELMETYVTGWPDGPRASPYRRMLGL